MDSENNDSNNMKHERDADTNCVWCTWDNPQRIGEGTRRLGNKRTSRDHPDYSIIQISQNTEKSPWDLRKLAVTQTLMKNHQLTSGVKKHKGV